MNKHSSINCDYIFTDEVLKKYLSKKQFKDYLNIKTVGGAISFELAQPISKAMRNWAIKHGANHYCHWFQPLTNQTTGKQTPFF